MAQPVQTAADGAVVLTERRYVEAAELFGQAAGYVPNGHASERGGYLLRQADALSRQGDERGDNAALSSAIEVYGRVQRGSMFRFIMIATLAICVVGIIAWLLSSLQAGPSVKTGGCSIANSGTATGNTVNCGPPPAAPAAKP